jgi:GNAT superfamily N-acetyltransferase
MEIAPLAEHPEHIPTLARWHLAEWGHYSTGRTQESTEERLRRHAASDAIPTTMVALEDGKPVGSAALVWNDMKTRPQIRPWLADVVVDPAWRRRGIGSKLVRRLVEKARRGVPRRRGRADEDQSHATRGRQAPASAEGARSEPTASVAVVRAGYARRRPHKWHASLGWETVERVEYRDEEVVLMKINPARV